jgi:hypothetical protein
LKGKVDKMKEEIMVVRQRKEGKQWVEDGKLTDEGAVYKRLAEALVAKKLNGCTWIKSITRKQVYTHLEIVVSYDNGYRDVFHMPAHM